MKETSDHYFSKIKKVAQIAQFEEKKCSVIRYNFEKTLKKLYIIFDLVF